MKPFKQFAHRQFKSLIGHLKKYEGSHDPELLHKVRVDVKKIKAVLFVIDDCTRGFKAHKNFIPFRKIFRRAASIREPDVLARLARQYKMDEISGDLTPGRIENLIIAFDADIPHFIKTIKKRRAKLQPHLKHVRKTDLTTYIQSTKKEVKSRLYPKPAMNIIHKVRKKVKEAIYLSEINDQLKKKETKFYSKIQRIIGQLHDKQVLLDHLSDKRNFAGNAQYETIRSACTADKRKIFSLASHFYG